MISDQAVRDLYKRFLELIRGFHRDVKLETSRVEVRAYFGKELICRVVPYRELFHVQIGEKSVWEIRVRDESGCLDTLDRVIERFLYVYASEKRIHP